MLVISETLVVIGMIFTLHDINNTDLWFVEFFSKAIFVLVL